MPDALVHGLASGLEDELQSRLEHIQASVKERLREAERRLREVEHAHESLRALSDSLGELGPSIDGLVARFGQSKPASVAESAG